MAQVHLYGELTRSCSAGDVVTVSGIFLPVPYAGFKAIRAGLITDTYLEAQSVEKHKKSYVDFIPYATAARVQIPRACHARCAPRRSSLLHGTAVCSTELSAPCSLLLAPRSSLLALPQPSLRSPCSD